MHADNELDPCSICNKPASVLRTVQMRRPGQKRAGRTLARLCDYHAWLNKTYESGFIDGKFWYLPERCWHCGGTEEYFVYITDGPIWQRAMPTPLCLKGARVYAKRMRTMWSALVTRNGCSAIVTRNAREQRYEYWEE